MYGWGRIAYSGHRRELVWLDPVKTWSAIGGEFKGLQRDRSCKNPEALAGSLDVG